MKLSPAQRKALTKMADEQGGVAGSDEYDYRSIGGLITARSLNRRGLIRMVSQHPPPRYQITDAGRAMLSLAAPERTANEQGRNSDG